MLKIRYKNDAIVKYLIFLLFILIPFNNLPSRNLATKLLGDEVIGSKIGMIGVEGTFYILNVIIIIALYIILKQKKIIINKKYFICFSSYIICIFISFTFNYNKIQYGYMKGISSIGLFGYDLFEILFQIIACYSLFILIRGSNISYNIVNKAICISFIIPVIYSVFEILNFNNIGFASSVLEGINKYIRGNSITFNANRMHSVSGEPAHLSIYLTFIFPWILNNIFEQKSKFIHYILFIYFFVMLYFTSSRFGYASMIILSIICLYFIIKHKSTGIRALKLGILITIVLAIFLNISNKYSDKIGYGGNIVSVLNSLSDGSNLSNVSRIGVTKASLRMGIDNPLFGVGLGQNNINLVNYIGEEYSKSFEIQYWIDPTPGTPWGTAGALYVKIISELGIVGIGIFFIFNYIVIKDFMKLIRINNKYYTLFLSYLSVLISYLIFASFRSSIYGILITLMVYYKEKEYCNA